METFEYCIKGYFRPMLILSIYACKHFRPILNSPKQSWAKKKDNLRQLLEFRPVLNRGEYFPEYRLILNAGLAHYYFFQCILNLS